MNKILKLLLINPFFYLLIELIFIEYQVGLSALNDLSTIEGIFAIVAAVILPGVIAFLMSLMLEGSSEAK